MLQVRQASGIAATSSAPTTAGRSHRRRARRRHGDFETVVHHGRLIARVDQFGDVLGETEDFVLARGQPSAGNKLRQRVAPCAVRLSATEMQCRGAALLCQPLANLPVLLDVILMKILDDFGEIVARHRTAAANQGFGKMERLVVRVVAKHADIGIAHQPVAHIDRCNQLAQHRPFRGDVGKYDDAHIAGTTALRAEPLLAARMREAIDDAIAIGLVFFGCGFEKFCQAASDRAVTRCAHDVQERLVGARDAAVFIDAHGRKPERSKLLKQRESVDAGKC